VCVVGYGLLLVGKIMLGGQLGNLNVVKLVELLIGTGRRLCREPRDMAWRRSAVAAGARAPP
jgi:hypothetical protein